MVCAIFVMIALVRLLSQLIFKIVHVTLSQSNKLIVCMIIFAIKLQHCSSNCHHIPTCCIACKLFLAIDLWDCLSDWHSNQPWALLLQSSLQSIFEIIRATLLQLNFEVIQATLRQSNLRLFQQHCWNWSLRLFEQHCRNPTCLVMSAWFSLLSGGTECFVLMLHCDGCLNLSWWSAIQAVQTLSCNKLSTFQARLVLLERNCWRVVLDGRQRMKVEGWRGTAF